MSVDLTLKIGGEAGQGMQTIGYVLCKTFARGGFYLFANQDYMSRIRGGHNFFQIRVKEEPVYALSEEVDILIALDKATVELHHLEIKEKGIIIFDGEHIHISGQPSHLLSVPLERLAREEGGNKLFSNSVAVGAALGVLSYEFDILAGVVKEVFDKRGEEIVQSNIKAAQAGYDFMQKNYKDICLSPLKSGRSDKKMLISGNESLSLGAMAAGCKFMSAYPMTPSTGIITYLAGKAKQYGLVAEQAEDEIAAINMAIGASFAGARAMVATSGGGFSLMVEALGLAGMTETPLVIVEAQRPGPSTGLPTRTAQADLEFVLHASQGEFPRAIFAPATAEDAFWSVVKAFNVAEKYQVPVIIMSDQHLADSYFTCKKFDLGKVKIDRGIISDTELAKIKDYRRHRFTQSGISPRAIPSQKGRIVITDSDEHDEEGHLTEDLELANKMVQKRLRKREGLVSEIEPPRVYPREDAELILIGWGSTYGALREALDVLIKQGMDISLMHFQEIWPFPTQFVTSTLSKVKESFCVENNATGQLAHIIQAETGKQVTGKILRFDGRAFSPQYIIRELKKKKE
ncbi:MAG: 2-oxoacid:acceptor oxidoreductase subunit alpha [Clostridia bacterium]|jgi:2-oxoglutarate ferredoxin oxidoreductase subunit alpha|nr:2-oxoacid:acceptor oxidoreductase subunit alpha [Clostridia bacterium]